MHIHLKQANLSPRNRVIRDVILAYANAELFEMAEYFHELIELNIIGYQAIKGKESLIKFSKNEGLKANNVDIEQVITHGKLASSIGKLNYSEEEFAFSIIFEFASAGSKLIRKITLFKIRINQC